MVNRVSIILFCTFLCFFNTFGQTEKVVFPIGTYHSKATKIVGVSVGLWQKNAFRDADTSSTKTVGLRLEAPGLSLLAALGGGTNISDSAAQHEERLKNRPKFSEIVDGISISATGLAGNMKINGLSINGILTFIEDGNGLIISAHYTFSENYQGMMIAFAGNVVYEAKGIQIAAFSNYAAKFSGIQLSSLNNATEMRGVQIGLINKSKKTRGIQIGLWNKNEKRATPFINWNFK